MNRYKDETHFETHFAEFVALTRRWVYNKIPDPIPFTRRSGMKGVPTAHRRPFDGLLSMPQGNIAVEFKMNSNKLSPHQWTALRKIADINGQAVVIRCRQGTKGTRYCLEIAGEKANTTTSYGEYRELEDLCDSTQAYSILAEQTGLGI